MAKSATYLLPDGSWAPSVSDVLQAHRSDYRSPVIEAAAVDGNQVHGLAADILRGEDVPPASAIGDADVRGRLRAFERWYRRRRVVAEAVEYRMEPLPCQLPYGGTTDCVLLLAEGRTVVDLKPARRDYLHFAQLGAYGALYEAHHPDRPIDRGLILHLGTDGQPVEDWLTREELTWCAWWFLELRSSFGRKEWLKERFAGKDKTRRAATKAAGRAA